jgi:hypothetical protein
MNLYEMAHEISRRLSGIFGRDSDARRPFPGGEPTVQHVPHWWDLQLYDDYGYGRNGAGEGAGHKTGWTPAVALLPLISQALTAPDILVSGLGPMVGATRRAGTAAS